MKHFRATVVVAIVLVVCLLLPMLLAPSRSASVPASAEAAPVDSEGALAEPAAVEPLAPVAGATTEDAVREEVEVSALDALGAPPDGRVFVTFDFVDAWTGEPVTGRRFFVQRFLDDGNRRTAFTSEAGTITLDVDPETDYLVGDDPVEAELAFGERWLEPDLIEPPFTHGEHRELRVGRTPDRLPVLVVEPDGSPASRALVAFRGATLEADADGRVEIEMPVFVGEWSGVLSARRVDGSAQCDAEIGSETCFDPVRIELVPVGSVSIVARWEDDGSPIVAEEVSVVHAASSVPARGLLDEHGRVDVEGIGYGPCEIGVFPGGGPYARSVTFRGQAELVVELPRIDRRRHRPSDEADAQSRNWVRVASGRVVDRFGRPAHGSIEATSPEVEETGRVAWTRDGVFHVWMPPCREIVLIARPSSEFESYEPSSVRVVAGASDVVFERTNLLETHAFDAKVLDDETGRSIAKWWFEVESDPTRPRVGWAPEQEFSAPPGAKVYACATAFRDRLVWTNDEGVAAGLFDLGTIRLRRGLETVVFALEWNTEQPIAGAVFSYGDEVLGVTDEHGRAELEYAFWPTLHVQADGYRDVEYAASNETVRLAPVAGDD